MHADKIGTRNRAVGKLAERRQSQSRQNYPQRAAEHAEHGAFREQLTDQSPAARPQRGPNGELLFSSQTARNQQIRNIRASDEQNEQQRSQ